MHHRFLPGRCRHDRTPSIELSKRNDGFGDISVVEVWLDVIVRPGFEQCLGPETDNESGFMILRLVPFGISLTKAQRKHLALVVHTYQPSMSRIILPFLAARQPGRNFLFIPRHLHSNLEGSQCVFRLLSHNRQGIHSFTVTFLPPRTGNPRSSPTMCRALSRSLISRWPSGRVVCVSRPG